MAENIINSSLMDQAEEELLKPLFEPINLVYIDADFLYDYRLGAMLLKTSTEDQYKYILEHIPEYTEGKSRSIAKYFPKLGFTDNEIEMAANDYGWQDLVHAAAPKTKFLDDLSLFLTRINTFNRSKMMTQPLQVIINSRYSPMPDSIWRELVGYIRDRDTVVRMSRTNYHTWYDVPRNLVERMSMILVYDLVDFLNEGTPSQSLLRQSKMLDKVILSPYQTEEDYDDPEKEEEAIRNFAAVMMTYTTEFSFVKKSIPIGK